MAVTLPNTGLMSFVIFRHCLLKTFLFTLQPRYDVFDGSEEVFVFIIGDRETERQQKRDACGEQSPLQTERTARAKAPSQIEVWCSKD